jgi:nucleoside-diphosphate-sugar epimerase
MAGKVLVLGASGLFGGRVAAAFAASGWQVRRYVRGTDMAQAAQGVDFIVNGLNPPMYHDWARLIPQITAQVIAAGLASGATVLLPGNVYVYGNQPGPWGPDTPHRPVARKGHIRAAMEARYRAAAAQGLQVIVLRAGDFLDEAGKTTVMNMFHLRRLQAGKITLGGAADVPRAYAYLPDLAQAAVMLAEKRAVLPAFADVPFAGLTFSMADVARVLETQLGRRLKMVRFPWWAMRLLGPVWELARELPEMRYLYDTPHRMDAGPLQMLLPDMQLTALDTIMAAHLRGLGLVRSGQGHIDPDRAVA